MSRRTVKLLGLLKQRLSTQQLMVLISIIVAMIAGLAAIIMKNSVHFIDTYLKEVDASSRWLYLFTPTVGILLVFVLGRLILKFETDGIPGILFAISRRNGRIGRQKMFSSLLSSILTVGFGGSVGLEGPSASTGAAIGSNIGKFFHISYKQKITMIGCGATAAIAAIFNTPIAAIVFSLEVLMLDLSISSIIVLLISSITAIIMSHFLLGEQTICVVDSLSNFAANDSFWYILLGCFAGCISALFTKVCINIDKLFAPFKKTYIRIMVGGLMLGILLFFFPTLYGEGYSVVNDCFRENFDFVSDGILISEVSNSWFILLLLILLLILKIFATNITLGAGGVGGIFAPSLFIGAVSGVVFGLLLKNFGFNVPPLGTLALVAMAGVMSGVLHGPLTGIFLIAELTHGYDLIVPLMLTSVVAFLITRLFSPNSVYTVQLAKRNELLTHDKDKSIMSMMRIERLLETDFYVLKDYYSLGDIVKGVQKSPRNVFPVVDDKQELIGILTLNDIRHIMFNQELWTKISVKDIMYQPEVSVDIDEPIENIAVLIQDSGHFNIPVLHKKKYLGFVSRANLFSIYQKISKELSAD